MQTPTPQPDNYKKKVPPAQRTADCSDDLSGRNRLLPARGTEAQWCIFDPIVSCIFGMKLTSSRSPQHFIHQTEFFNRSLGQITGDEQKDVPPFRCPELYYLENGNYVANDHVPLLWTQANLMLAMHFTAESCQL